MTTQNNYLDNEDLLFHVRRRIDLDSLFRWLSDDQKELAGAASGDELRKNWDQVLETLGQLCAQSIAPRADEIDRSSVALVDGKVELPEKVRENLKLLVDWGAPALSVGTRYGGMGGTLLFEMIGCELLNRACPSTLLNSSWYGLVARVLETYGSEELCQKYIPRIASGELSGNMALTEADAGSDLAALRTYAVDQGDGTFHLFGTKRFITNGNGHLSLVLAKDKKGAIGLGHLSLYLCPLEVDGKQNIEISKVESKVALNGSATCEMRYHKSKAWVVGELGQGYRYMLDLMNDSRIGVGFQGVGLMEACLRIAKEYTSERTTWGRPIAQHELIAEKLLDLEVELKATRSLGYQAAFCRTMIYAGEAYLQTKDSRTPEFQQVQREVRDYERRSKALTPLLKYWVGEKSVEHARGAMQMLGGYGFTREYPAEKWVRESLIYSVYEGTSQIQALTCIKDTIKEIIHQPKDFLEHCLEVSCLRFGERDPLLRKFYLLQHYVCRAVASIIYQLAKIHLRDQLQIKGRVKLALLLKSLQKKRIKFKNFRPAMLHAERICQMKCFEALAKALLDDLDYDANRHPIAERFIHNTLPQVRCLLSQIAHSDEVIKNLLDDISRGDLSKTP